jgi:hypothetical protein
LILLVLLNPILSKKIMVSPPLQNKFIFILGKRK